jgi:hypothetical protein
VWQDGLLASATIGDCSACDIDAAEDFETIVRAPPARYLQRLSLWGHLHRVPEAIARYGVPPTLTLLGLLEPDPAAYHPEMYILRAAGHGPELPTGPQPVPGVLGPLHLAYPRLRHLEDLLLYSGGIDFGAIDLPSLQNAEIHTDFTSENLASIGRAAWPRLDDLKLFFGWSVQRGGMDVADEDDLGCAACTPDDILSMLMGDGLPELLGLSLVGLSFADVIAERLHGVPLLEQLRLLDLSKGRMTDAGAEHLLRARRALSHLDCLDVSENFLSDSAVVELAAAFPDAVVTPQRQVGVVRER